MHQFKYCKAITSSDPTVSYHAAINERPSNGASPGNRTKRSVGEHTKYWQSGKTLKIVVVRYDEHSFAAVKIGASKWLPYINLQFEFIELDEQTMLAATEFLGDIRVDFQPGLGSSGSSLIGTDSRTGSPDLPSMVLGTNFSSPYYEAMVVHEFGHALGLGHEHQHPDAGIPWDRAKTYSHMANTTRFSKAEVDANVFPLERSASRVYTPYDRHSIMHYQVLDELTLGDWHQPVNLHISQGDIAAVRAIYP